MNPDVPAAAEPGVSRRRLLGSAAAAGGMATALSLLPTNVAKALADQAASGSAARGRLRDVEHVVLIMQENRSFDHYFGTLAGVRGFADDCAAQLDSGRSVFYQPDPSNPDGYLLPFHLDSRTTAAQAIPSTGHGWAVQHAALNGGAMDSWVTAHTKFDGAAVGPFTMGYYTRKDIPFHYALADAFTVYDNYFCSVIGPTHPNRYMYMTGTIDPNGRFGGPAIDNSQLHGTYSWTSYPERLTEAGVSWMCYQETDSYGSNGFNVLQFLKQYIDAPKDSTLYKSAMVSTPAGQFEYDALNDKLPTVSWVFPTLGVSEHPDALPNAGAAWLASKLDAIAANPEVWAKTLVIINYDENDGLFDHVTPPLPPDGTPDEFVTRTSPGGTAGGGQPIGAGYRVPCIVVSPWTVGGNVCSTPLDHTSVLRFLERLTGVAEPNISDWRRSTFGDFTEVFDRRASRGRFPALPDTSGPLTLAAYEAGQLPLPAFPGAGQTFPVQERGRRRRLG
ncbi:alkaline phosphatase family protein [Catenulispora rubra]|uniref:alkaline phosphatase family protein n=1 Tax=Catenulispora rubra TaxID=280293 RepID=UPI00189250ED|nr:alkaline phosphatase family protein [Catenulispora rubra]